MADITITTKQLVSLAPVLAAVGKLFPPPSPKGRFVLAKAAEHAQTAFEQYSEQNQKLALRVATRDAEDKPIFKDSGNGQLAFTVQPDLVEEYAAESAELLAKPVVLAGVRMITHAELSPALLTVDQERVLINCGLLEDVEPA